MYEVRFNKNGKGRILKRPFKHLATTINFVNSLEKRGYKVVKIIKLEDKEI